jgi:hypothetical protein
VRGYAKAAAVFSTSLIASDVRFAAYESVQSAHGKTGSSIVRWSIARMVGINPMTNAACNTSDPKLGLPEASHTEAATIPAAAAATSTRSSLAYELSAIAAIKVQNVDRAVRIGITANEAEGAIEAYDAAFKNVSIDHSPHDDAFKTVRCRTTPERYHTDAAT